jgi:phosphopantothenoylcysteine decarboxylase / phosphopantothenate---cysteine ligase
MNDANATFGYDTNKLTVLKKELLPKEFSLKRKSEVAKDIVKEISSLLINQYKHKELARFE